MRGATAAAVLLVLAACAGPVDGTATAGPDPGAAAVGPDDSTEVCARSAVPELPPGVALDLTRGRGLRPAGLSSGPTDVAVLDLPGDAAALAAAVAPTLDACGDGEPVVAAGGLGALVVAGVRAAAERRPLAPPAALDVAADGASAAVAAAAAAIDLLARWEATEVLLVAEEDVVAWSALIVEASDRAVPLVLPTPDPATPDPAAPDPEAPDPAAPDPPAPDPAAPDPAAPEPAEPEDPAGPALGLLPADVTVTVVASDAMGATALADRVVAAGRPAPAVRVVASGSGVPPAGWDGGPGGTVWLIDPADPIRLVVGAAAAGARDDAVLVVAPHDPNEILRRAEVLRLAAPTRIVLVGGPSPRAAVADAPATTAWALDVALHTDPLPWGGWLPLDGTRIVALYGTPGAPALGALGQQDLDATFDRVRETAARYDLDGLRIVPGFDLIVTVASAAPGPAGDYSQRVSIERLRPLVDRARVEGMAVFIDLQPGRTDFLTQAQEYEELLLEPHVFLALDPEWRLRSDQVHLRQIGSVQAEEVQRVADWLAELVRRERLPQKGFMLHQFLLEMLPDRDTVVVPPELVGIVHVDGQGAVATKERTFRIMAEGADPQWRWGWKQFLRIDTPAVMDPADVIDRLPLPVVITYQ